MPKILAAALVLAAALPAALAAQERRTENVVLIVSDGVRWQEVVGGAESLLVSREAGGVDDTAALRRDFWRATAAARREALFPFLWGRLAEQGQLFGDLAEGSDAHVTNGMRFSYPGYNEMLTGHPDSAIDRNTFGPNPNRTVFAWLASLPRFRGQVAAFGTWDVFADIFDRAHAGFPVHAAFDPPPLAPRGDGALMLDRLYRTTTRQWGSTMSFDAFMQALVVDYVRREKPRVLFVGYGETDEWAHEGRYDLYLRSARQVDAFVEELWRTMQAMPQYRDRTTFVITTDHGRGSGPAAWKDHGRRVDGAEQVWVAVIGPDTPALGARRATGPVTQAQVAATVAALLGEDWHAAEPRAALPITDVLSRER